MPVAPIVLDNDEKKNIVNQHLRSLQFAIYNADLDLIEANAVASPDEALIAEVTARKTDLNAKVAALEAEKSSLVSE